MNSKAKFNVNDLKFNQDGLIPCIAQDAQSHAVLMMAWMNAQAIEQTLETGDVTYWSRSRSEFWVKGATSGNTQKLVSLRMDCDRDCLLALVEQNGPACHTGRRSCFYTEIQNESIVEILPVMRNERSC